MSSPKEPVTPSGLQPRVLPPLDLSESVSAASKVPNTQRVLVGLRLEQNSSLRGDATRLCPSLPFRSRRNRAGPWMSALRVRTRTQRVSHETRYCSMWLLSVMSGESLCVRSRASPPYFNVCRERPRSEISLAAAPRVCVCGFPTHCSLLHGGLPRPAQGCLCARTRHFSGRVSRSAFGWGEGNATSGRGR